MTTHTDLIPRRGTNRVAVVVVAFSIVADDTTEPEWVGPCGCTGCEKWTDCEWCGTCSAQWA